MPNKRARNKVFFGGFVERRTKARLTRAAGAAGMRGNVFGFAMAAVEERLERLERSRSKRQLDGPEPAAKRPQKRTPRRSFR
jgi:hypothetical protein